MSAPKYGTLQWKAYQYEQNKISRRGRNYKYDPDGKIAEKIESSGYVFHKEFQFPSSGMDEVLRLRKSGHFARMLLYANKVRGCPDVHIYKKLKP